MVKFEWTKKKKRKKNMSLDLGEPRKFIVDTLCMTIFIVFIISTTWDITMTFSGYLRYPATFLEMEANPVLTWGLENGIPFFFNPSIILHIVLIPTYFIWKKSVDEYINTKTHNKHWQSIFSFVCFMIILVIISMGHTFGGGSWIPW